MISIKNIRTPTGEVVNYQIPSEEDREITAQESWALLPGFVDPDLSLGPDQERERFLGIEAAILGGVTTALETPLPPLILPETFLFDLPLHHWYLQRAQGPHPSPPQLRNSPSIKGIIVDPPPSSLPLSDPSWEEIFRFAAQHDLPLLAKASQGEGTGHPLLKTILEKTERWGNRLLVLDIRNEEQIELVHTAKNRGLLVSSEIRIHNLSSAKQREAEIFWQAIEERVIECVGSGYIANQQTVERIAYRGMNASAYSPLFSLPQMLQAVKNRQITLERCVEMTSLFAQDFFHLPKRADFIVVDLTKPESVHRHFGREASSEIWTGWPVCTILGGKLFFPPSSGYPQPDEFFSL